MEVGGPGAPSKATGMEFWGQSNGRAHEGAKIGRNSCQSYSISDWSTGCHEWIPSLDKAGWNVLNPNPEQLTLTRATCRVFASVVAMWPRLGPSLDAIANSLCGSPLTDKMILIGFRNLGGPGKGLEYIDL